MRAHEFTEQGAAGIVLYAEDTGRYGLQQRSNRINDGGLWAAWGGGREPGESLEQCARRELAEESGYTGPVKLTRLGENPRYVTFLGVVPHEFEPRPDDEWQDYCWVEAGDWPSPMHPGVTAALKNIPVEEGLKSKLAGAALAGGMALGAGGAHAMDWKDAAMTGAMFVPGIGQVAKAYNVGSNLWNAAKAAKQYKTLGKEIDAIAAKQAAQPKQATTVEYDPDNADKFEPVDENFADNDQWLYHATYRPLLKSIKAHGLGGDRAQAKWEDSKPGVVYLARDPDVAESYAESSDVVPDEWLDQIVVFKIRADQLDPSRLSMDQNVQDNAGDTLEYHGVIPVASLSLTENFADGKVKGKSRPGRVKRAGASCDGSVTSLRAKAKKYGGERGKMYHWCANMKGGKKK